MITYTHDMSDDIFTQEFLSQYFDSKFGKFVHTNTVVAYTTGFDSKTERLKGTGTYCNTGMMREAHSARIELQERVRE